MSCRTIREVSVLPPMTNQRIGAIKMAPQTLLMSAVQKIFLETASGNIWESRIPRRISRTDIDGSTPIYTPIHSGISKNSTLYPRESTGTMIPIGISGTSTAPLACDLWIPEIWNKRQPASPNLRNSDKLDAAVDGNFTNNPVSPPIFTEVFCDKVSDSYIWNIYARCGMHLATDTANPVTPQFEDHGFSIVDTLNKGNGI